MHICISEVKKHNTSPEAAKAQLFTAMYKAHYVNKVFPLGKCIGQMIYVYIYNYAGLQIFVRSCYNLVINN